MITFVSFNLLCYVSGNNLPPNLEVLMVYNFFRFDRVHPSVYFVAVDFYFFLMAFNVYFQFNFIIIFFSLAVQLEAWYQKMRMIFSQTVKEIMGTNI